MAESPFMDPRFMGLATLASGLLSAAGPRPYPVSFGQAIGQSGISALQAMQQARAQQIQLEDAQLRRQLIGEEIKKYAADAATRQADAEGIAHANRIIGGLQTADLSQYGGPNQSGQGLPGGPGYDFSLALPFLPSQQGFNTMQAATGFAEGASSLGINNIARPGFDLRGGLNVPREIQPRPGPQDIPPVEARRIDRAIGPAQDMSGVPSVKPVDVTPGFSPWDILRAQADYLTTMAGNLRGEKGSKRLLDQAKIFNDRADRLEKAAAPSEFKKIAAQAGLKEGTPAYAAAQANWLKKQTEFAPPQNINMYSTSLIPAVDAKGNPVFIQPSGKEGVAPRIVSGYAPPEAASEKKVRMSEQLARQNTERTIGLIDDVIHYVQSNPSTVGVFGLGKGLYESAAGQLNANQPQTVAALQTKIRILQSAIWRDLVGGGQLSQKDYEQIDNIIRGLGPLDTVNSVVDAMNQVKSYIQNKANVQPEYTQEDLEYTAKKYGISVDEVKKRLRGR